MKKKTIALIMAILAVVLCFTLAACGDKNPTGDETDLTNDVVDATDDTADAGETEEATDDFAYIKEKGKMIASIIAIVFFFIIIFFLSGFFAILILSL